MILENKIKDYLKRINPSSLGLENMGDNPSITGSYSGESNKVYFFEWTKKPFVLKINGVEGKDSSFFKREFDKLKSLERYKIAPKAYIYDKDFLDSPSIILEMIPGNTLKDIGVNNHLEEIIGSLNEMVEIPSGELKNKNGFKRDINNCWEYVHMFPSHAEFQLKEYLMRIGQDNTYKLSKKASINCLKRIEQSKGIFEDSEMGLIHTGLHPENIILTPKGEIKLVDWEHSGIGDRAFEISSLLRSNNFSSEEIEKIYKEYMGQTGNFRERVQLYTDLFKVHEVLWHALRYDKSMKGEVNLSREKTQAYYQELLNKHLENLRNSNLV